MATYKSIPLASIHIGERARPIDEDHALAIASSMAERGLINPITVRSTPAMNKGKTPYTLVAGGHRLRGAALNQWVEIDTIIVEADATEAQLIELSENIFRNELSKLDRPIFVMKLREVMEEKHGKIERGRYSDKKGNDYPFTLAPGKELSKLVQERLGFGEETYKLVTRIGQNLHADLRNALRGTSIENDQSKLLKLAKLPPEDQVKAAAALREGADIAKVFEWIKGPVVPAISTPETHQSALLKKLIASWDDASEQTRFAFLEHIGMTEGGDPLLRLIKQEAEAA